MADQTKEVYLIKDLPCPNCFIHGLPCIKCKINLILCEGVQKKTVTLKEMNETFQFNFEEKFWIDERIVCIRDDLPCRFCYIYGTPCKFCRTRWTKDLCNITYMDFNRFKKYLPDNILLDTYDELITVNNINKLTERILDIENGEIELYDE